MQTKIGLVDDHQLFLKSLCLMLESFKKYEVIVEALNGSDLQEKLEKAKQIPDLILLDVNMPVMGGLETAKWLQQNYPSIKLVALSMNDSDKSIINMIKAGCCAYILKETHPLEFAKALEDIVSKGYYNGDASNINFRRLLEAEKAAIALSEKEKEFLALTCTEMTYKQIADKMKVSERTVDGYRETMFAKLKVQSRVGLVMEAIRKEYISI